VTPHRGSIAAPRVAICLSLLTSVAFAACANAAGTNDDSPLAAPVRDGSAAVDAGGVDGGPGGGNGGDASTSCGALGESCCTDYKCGAGLACDGARCGVAVAAYTCAPGAPEAVLVSETAPPLTLPPWGRAYASVTYANCSNAPWSATAGPPTGTRLGPSAPRDLDLFTSRRVALPADVAPGQQVTVAFAVHAPPLTGPHLYAMDLVRDGVAWLGVPSPVHTVTVTPAASPAVSLCPGITADPSGALDATAALQACFDATASGGTLALPPGIFKVGGVVAINKPMTVTTLGAAGAPASCLSFDAPPCAVLRADVGTSPAAASTRGFVRLGALGTPVTGVTLEHLVIDGNRGARLASVAAAACAAGQNGEGINVGANCASCTILGTASARALCGSAMEWDGDGITVKNSVFWGNGDHAKQNMWSDGLTIHKSDGAVVSGSRFVDNSDVGLITGGGQNAHYTSNQAEQLSQTAFAAIMLDNFNNSALGDHRGSELTANVVACPAGCHFGIELGPHPWYASPNILGGTVTGNTVLGANIEINVQGAGTVAAPTIIGANTLGPTPTSAMFMCGTMSGLSPLNVSAESVVTLQGITATGSISVTCP
jgi:hypothetical protein